MPQTVSDRIYEAFFQRLAELEAVRPETIEALKESQRASRLADKTQMTRLLKAMESRHAQSENPDR